MDDLLFLTQRIPYPPDKGDKIRSWHMLRHLAERYRVHLGCFVDDPQDLQHVPRLRELTGDSLFLPLSPPLARLRGLTRLVTGQPLTLGYFHDRRMAGWVRRVLERRPVKAVFVFSSAMAGYVMGDTPARLRRVADLVDMDSAKWGQYSHRAGWPLSSIYARERTTLAAFECRVARAFDATVLVSEPEADLLRAAAPDAAERILAVDNGVDHGFFSPDAARANPYPAGIRPIVFTGAMDYRPNIDAVSWFATEVLPRVMSRHPTVRFHIVGANPSLAVSALAQSGAVMVTGRVADVRGYLAHAAMAVAPLRIAQGVQNKVLEAMAMARPVVVTSQALLGIDALPGRHLLLADDAAAFADTVSAELAAPSPSLGRRARRRVIERYDWSASLARLEGIIAGKSPLPLAGEGGARKAGG